MDNENVMKYGCAYGGCSCLILIIAFISAWIVYGTLIAGFWTILLWIALGLLSLIGFIPVAGPFLYWHIANANVLPSLMSAGNLTSTWITTGILYIGLLGSIGFTIIGVIIICFVLVQLFSQ